MNGTMRMNDLFTAASSLSAAQIGLHRAAQIGSVRLAEALLLERGADANVKNEVRHTRPPRNCSTRTPHARATNEH